MFLTQEKVPAKVEPASLLLIPQVFGVFAALERDFI